MKIVIRVVVTLVFSLLSASTVRAHDEPNDNLIPGGGSEKTDCMVQFFGGDLNYPAPPKPAKVWRCYDGEQPCDQSPAGDGVCEFALGVCLNGTSHSECTPTDVASILVKNKPVGDPKYDAGLGALQTSIDALTLPTAIETCTVDPAVVSVPLKTGNKPGSKNVQLKSASSPGALTGKVTKDSDKLKLRCETCPANGTFENIAQFIFSGSCATGTCHVGPIPPASLNLEPANAHAELVNVVPTTASAAAAGKKLVDPGNPDNSFILDKLCGPDPGDPDPRPAVCATHNLVTGSSADGDPMPPPTGGLSEAKINAIHDWIAAGAPATGWVPGTHCGVPADVFQPIAPLAPPPAPGFQLELPPFDLAPGQEIEGCMWVQVPNTSDLDVGAFEIAMNENSHHFILHRWVDNGNPPPTLNVWDPTDIGCNSGGFFSENMAGSQDPYAMIAYPDGLARTIHPGDIIGLNSHYINTLNVPIQGHVYANFYAYTGTEPHHTAKTLFAIDANGANTGIGLFGPGIAPFTTGVTPGNWVNPENPGACIVGLTSHMHRRGTRFIEEYPVGNQIYENTDWDHPYVLNFPSPLWVPHGDTIHYECTHDNGFSNPADVYRNQNGIAAPLYFGFSANQEMCIMPGLYFVPPVAGDCSLP